MDNSNKFSTVLVIVFALLLVFGSIGVLLHARLSVPSNTTGQIATTSQPSAVPANSPKLEQATSLPPNNEDLEATESESTPDIYTKGRVLDIVDGDTIEVVVEGKACKVKYIGIDCPDTAHPTKPAQWFGREACEKNSELVFGKMVGLEKDISETDRYGRLLRYVWLDDMMINAELIRLGYAQVATYPPDVKYQSLFLRLESEARAEWRGLWSIPKFISPDYIGFEPQPSGL